MMDVEVRNFQSIERVVFKIEGFTALVGRSNIGKSALVRAIKAALTGAPVTSFVRHGKACLRRTKKAKACKCFASVHLKAEGYDLLWEKGDAINRYTFNGNVYDKAEKGTPEFLSPAFLPVKIGDKQELLQVADQFTPIFLLDQTGGVVADVLSDAARLDRFNVALRLAEKDRREAVQTRKIREKDVVDIQTKLMDFEGLDVAVTMVVQVQGDLEEIDRHDATILKLDHFLATGAAIGQRIRLLETGLAVVVPEPETLSSSVVGLRSVEDWLSQTQEYEEAIERLVPVEKVEVPRDSFQEPLAAITQLARWHGQLLGLRDWFNVTKPIEALPELDATALKEARGALEWVQGRLSQLQALEGAVARLEAAYEAVLVEEKEAHDEIEALGVCPTCVRPLGAA